MNRDQSNHRHLFYRLQFFFYVALVLCTVAGIFVVHITVESSSARLGLTLLFVIVDILIACTQLIIQYTLLTNILAPVQKFTSTMREILSSAPEEMERLEEAHLQQIRNSLTTMRDAMTKSSLLPSEIQELMATVTQIIVSLEKAWSQASAVTTLTSMGGVCSQVAHDMRGPLSAIKTFLKLVPLNGDEDIGKLKDGAIHATDRMLAMAVELLEFRRAQEIERREFDLALMVKSVCDELTALADTRQVQLTYEGPCSLSFSGDAHKLSRVLHNLAQNAIQAIVEGGAGIVKMALRKVDDRLVLQVIDSGPGIKDEHLSNLFTKSFTTKGKKGNGLGLLYCSKVVKSHGGEIGVENADPHGAIFSIQLPCAA